MWLLCEDWLVDWLTASWLDQLCWENKTSFYYCYYYKPLYSFTPLPLCLLYFIPSEFSCYADQSTNSRYCTLVCILCMYGCKLKWITTIAISSFLCIPKQEIAIRHGSFIVIIITITKLSMLLSLFYSWKPLNKHHNNTVNSNKTTFPLFFLILPLCIVSKLSHNRLPLLLPFYLTGCMELLYLCIGYVHTFLKVQLN